MDVLRIVRKRVIMPTIHKKKVEYGMGVFSDHIIPAGSMIKEFKGEFFNKSNLPKTNYYLQIGSDLYLGPSGDHDDYFNHSCSPNAYVYIVGSRAFLYSIYDIPINKEITFDYSLTSSETFDEWSMPCNCKSYECRKNISGFKTLSKTKQDFYKGINVVPKYNL